jgi:hypothetical protein
MNTSLTPGGAKTAYNRFLLLVAGLGSLLYGVGVGMTGEHHPGFPPWDAKLNGEIADMIG